MANFFLTQRGVARAPTSLQEQSPVIEQETVVKIEDELEQQMLAEGVEEEGQNEVDANSESSSDSEALEDSSSEDEVVRPPPRKVFRHHAVGPLKGRFVIHKVKNSSRSQCVDAARPT